MERARQLLDCAERRILPLPDRGVDIAILDWGGDGPLALLHHANGFCKGVWALVADALRDSFRVVAMDARGHGDSSCPEGPLVASWCDFADDVAAVSRMLCNEIGQLRVPLAIGHSFGGTSTLGAAARNPGLFERVLLVDPVTPAPPQLEIPLERQEHVQYLVDGARKRRSDWPSREEARAWFGERSLFEEWLPEALDLYVLDGLREVGEGGVALKCPGEVEAAVFASSVGTDIAAWAAAADVPTLWLWAERGNFSRERYQELASRMPKARVESVAAGHLVPMERPDLVADAARRLVASPD